VRDIDTAVVDGLKVLDPNRPIREATELWTSLVVRFVPKPEVADTSRTNEKPPEGGSLNSTR
jgi:hypothetical protein